MYRLIMLVILFASASFSTPEVKLDPHSIFPGQTLTLTFADGYSYQCLVKEQDNEEIIAKMILAIEFLHGKIVKITPLKEPPPPPVNEIVILFILIIFTLLVLSNM